MSIGDPPVHRSPVEGPDGALFTVDEQWLDFFRQLVAAANSGGVSLDGVAYRAGGNTFTGAQIVTPVSLVDGATISVDASAGNHFTVTLGGNRTLADPTNLVNGVILNFKIRQDGTGSRTLAYGSKYKWAGGTAPTLSTAADAVDYISAHYFADQDILVCAIIKDVR